jgi:hypothetical protein
VHLEVRGVQEQVVQGDLVESARAPGGELVADGLADPADGGAGQRGLGAEHLGQGRFDVAVRQPAHPTRDDQGLERVGPGHAGAEERRAEPFVGGAELGAPQLDRAHGGLDRSRGLVAVARAGGAVLVPALVAGSGQEGVHFGLDGALHHQAHRQPSHLLEDLGQGSVDRGEQLVDVHADGVNGRYSLGHGCRSSFVDLSGLEGTYARGHLHQRMDATQMLKGLPDDRCQCPHWGYVFKGQMRVSYADHEDVIGPGDAFYMPPGHIPAAIAGTKFVQFSPTDELAVSEAAIAKNMQEMQGGR